MSVGSLGIAASIVGSPAAQASGAAPERARQDAASHQRQVESIQQAADAAGIGQTNEDHQTSDRDADGRRPWEYPAAPAGDQQPADDASATAGEAHARPRDPTGDAGAHLDLTG